MTPQMIRLLEGKPFLILITFIIVSVITDPKKACIALIFYTTGILIFNWGDKFAYFACFAAVLLGALFQRLILNP